MQLHRWSVNFGVDDEVNEGESVANIGVVEIIFLHVNFLIVMWGFVTSVPKSKQSGMTSGKTLGKVVHFLETVMNNIYFSCTMSLISGNNVVSHTTHKHSKSFTCVLFPALLNVDSKWIEYLCNSWHREQTKWTEPLSKNWEEHANVYSGFSFLSYAHWGAHLSSAESFPSEKYFHVGTFTTFFAPAPLVLTQAALDFTMTKT